MAEDVLAGKFVLIIGAMAIDAKGKPDVALVPGTSTPGMVRLSVGGVARNVAENLSRLGVRTRLLSAVGDDPSGRLLLDLTAASGVDVSHVITVPDYRTATYIAVLDRYGVPAHAIDDMSITHILTPRWIEERRDLFRDAAMVVCDANLLADTLATVFDLAASYGCPVCVDLTSTSLAPRLLPHLPQIYLLRGSIQEAQALLGEEGQSLDAQRLAMRLVNMGAETAIVTLAEMGLYYATSGENGRMPALRRDIVDLTGAGDALTAAVIFGLLNEFPIGEAVRLGISAAALTIQCPETVCPDLSLERLYDELVI